MMEKMQKRKRIYYGKETAKALENFRISGLKPQREYCYAVAIIKKAAARVNSRLGFLEINKSNAIINSCNEILDGKFDDQFVVDPYQAGAGTSQNMNINEVIAERATEISKLEIHPNDDVNMSQSTNDVIPAAIRIACLNLLPHLLTVLNETIKLMSQKSDDFSEIIKSGRTHLKDALPVTLGQEFSSYSKAVEYDMLRIKNSSVKLLNIGIGGTAVGTGINTHPDYHRFMVGELGKLTRLKLKSPEILLEAANNTADFLELSGSLRILAANLIRIGNDLRLLSSGPGAGFSEINLPEVQAGSSIMPGKVNPSIVEMLTMVCFQIIGMDQAILQSTLSGQLELNVFLPLIALNLIGEIKLLMESVAAFNRKCLKDIQADKNMCQFWFKRSSGAAAVLNPYLGYDKTAILVRESLEKNLSIEALAVKKGYFGKNQASEIFSPKNLTGPNLKAKKFK